MLKQQEEFPKLFLNSGDVKVHIIDGPCGQGRSVTVYPGTYNDGSSERPVAVKVARKSAAEVHRELIRRAQLGRMVTGENVVEVLGLCAMGGNTLALVTELAESSLSSLLREQPPSMFTRISIAMQLVRV